MGGAYHLINNLAPKDDSVPKADLHVIVTS